MTILLQLDLLDTNRLPPSGASWSLLQEKKWLPDFAEILLMELAKNDDISAKFTTTTLQQNEDIL